MYGAELILDVKNCNVGKFTRHHISDFLVQLCGLIGMTPCVQHIWEDDGIPEGEKLMPHVEGISAVQFISTSSITLHALFQLGELYLNVFSCSQFPARLASRFTREFFEGDIMDSGFSLIQRGFGSKR